MKRPLIFAAAAFFGSLLCGIAYGTSTDLCAMSIDNKNVYKIDPSTGSVTVITEALYPSIGIAADEYCLYYWNTDWSTRRGIARWDARDNTHTLINSDDFSEKNAATRSNGTLWVLNMSYTYDPVAKRFIEGYTDELYQIDKITGTRTFSAHIDTFHKTRGFTMGDIAWGPDDKKLYISTLNVDYRFDSYNNYVWDPAAPPAEQLSKMGGEYYAGLAWIGNKLYGTRAEGRTSMVFELNPTDFSEMRHVATMPTGVTIGDLTVAPVPEPATAALLVLGGLAVLRKSKTKKA
jgi:hypothetical protein